MKLIGIAILLAAVAGIALGQIQWDHARLEAAQQRTAAQTLAKDAPELADSEKATPTELDMIRKLLEIVKLQGEQITQLEQRVAELETAAREAEARQ